MPRTTEASSSRKNYKSSFLNDTAIEIIKRYTPARTYSGFSRFSSYKDEHGEWLIGYGSKKLGKSYVGAFTRGSTAQIEAQLVADLEEFAEQVRQLIIMPLNEKKKAAVLSYAHSIGIVQFKDCRILHLINRRSNKNEIIRAWSPYINKNDLYPEKLRDRRRTELNTFLAPDEKVPLFIEHKCPLKYCLLNIGESYMGTPNQIKAIEYLEKKINDWDANGEVIRRFFRYWNEQQGGTGSPRNI